MSRSRCSVIFLPDWRDENPYLELLAKGLAHSGARVKFCNYPNTRFPLLSTALNHRDAGILHIHWLNDYIKPALWGSGAIRFLAHSAILISDVLLTRAMGVKVIWTVHNKLSHESSNQGRETRLRRWLMNCVSDSVFHSKNAQDEVARFLQLHVTSRSHVIPHGNYIDVYRDNPRRELTLANELLIEEHHRVILFFGLLRRYKGVDRLLTAFRSITDDNVRLVIAGKPMDQEVGQLVESFAKVDPRIKPLLGFIPDEDVAPLFRITDIAVVPFERTLSSGSAILALSMGNVLILPDTADVLDLPKSRGVLYYKDDQELLETLRSLNNSEVLADMRRENLNAAREMDWQTIGKQTSAVYRCRR